MRALRRLARVLHPVVNFWLLPGRDGENRERTPDSQSFADSDRRTPKLELAECATVDDDGRFGRHRSPDDCVASGLPAACIASGAEPGSRNGGQAVIPMWVNALLRTVFQS
jgi:hypothetical protein